MRTFAAIALLILAAGFAASPQLGTGRISPATAPSGPRRVALVIGDAAYQGGNSLVNSVLDAKDIGATLPSLSFAVVEAEDASLKELEKAVNQFVGTLKAGDLALVDYSGHGIQFDGENYLVPVDFAVATAVDARYAADSAERLQERVAEAGVSLNILILDACRNSPFKASRGGPSGWAAMQSGKGGFIAFATAPSETASHGPGQSNGLFTKHLLRSLAKPHLTIMQIFQETTEAVYKESGGRQQPWMAMSITGGFVFRDPLPGDASAGRTLPQGPSQIIPPMPVPEPVRDDASAAELQSAEERLIAIRSQAEGQERTWNGRKPEYGSLRSDIAVPVSDLKQFVGRAARALRNKDAAGTNCYLDSAEKQLEILKRKGGR